MADRGQTETLGFVLVFALIISSIGIVFATGFTGLNDVREFEATNNAERAFEVLADNIEDVTHRSAPSRSTEIKLTEAEIRLGTPIQLEINDPDTTFNVSYDLRPIVYDAATGTELVYVQGAVIRADDSGDATMIHESTLVIDENRTVVPVVQTRSGGTTELSGTTTVLVRADLSQTRLTYVNTSPSNQVWLNVTTPRAEAWLNHLDETYPDATCTRSGDAVSCSVVTDRLSVTLFQIDVVVE